MRAVDLKFLALSALCYYLITYRGSCESRRER
jgi:hypothetical protein